MNIEELKVKILQLDKLTCELIKMQIITTVCEMNIMRGMIVGLCML